ncbi:hypothetical protein LJR098_004753 [Rhizobium sp. LjRoot98]|nr:MULTISPECIES: hypothetical protein [unclassified Rhizobium]
MTKGPLRTRWGAASWFPVMGTRRRVIGSVLFKKKLQKTVSIGGKY